LTKIMAGDAICGHFGRKILRYRPPMGYSAPRRRLLERDESSAAGSEEGGGRGTFGIQISLMAGLETRLHPPGTGVGALMREIQAPDAGLSGPR
jgi:hypothetical protein